MLQKIAASQSAAITVLDHEPSPWWQGCTVKFNTIPALTPLTSDRVWTAEPQWNNFQGHPVKKCTPNLSIKQHYLGGTITETRVLLTAERHKGRSCGFDYNAIPEHLQCTSISSRVSCLAQCGCNEKLDAFKGDRHVEDKLKLDAHSHGQSMRILTLWWSHYKKNFQIWKVTRRREVSLNPSQLKKCLDQQFCRSRKVSSAEIWKSPAWTEQLRAIYPLPVMEVGGICRVRAFTPCQDAAES